MPSPFPNLPPEKRGHVRTIDHQSELLKNNPFGDPSRRDVYVYEPPGYAESQDRYPSIMVLPGYTGTGEKLLARGFTDVSIATRIDRLIAAGLFQAPVIHEAGQPYRMKRGFWELGVGLGSRRCVNMSHDR